MSRRNTMYGLEEVVEFSKKVVLVGGVGSAWGVEVNAVGEECEAEGVALAMQQFHEYGCSVDAECELVWIIYITLSFNGEEHGVAVVDDELTA